MKCGGRGIEEIIMEKDVFIKKAKSKVPISAELLSQLESLSYTSAREILELLDETGMLLENLTLDDAVKTEFINEDLRIDILQTSKNPDSFVVLVSKRNADEWIEIEHHNGFDTVKEAMVKVKELLVT